MCLLLLLIGALLWPAASGRAYFYGHPQSEESDKSIYKFAKYVVSIQSVQPRPHNFDIFGENHHCAGTIVSPIHVLTAAHCVYDVGYRRQLDASELVVIAGSPNRLRPSAQTLVLDVRSVHPFKVQGKLLEHDLAVLRLEDMLQLNISHGLGIAEMAMEPPPEFSDCFVLGWGQSQVDAPLAELLRQRKVQLQKHHECSCTFLATFGCGLICATVDRTSEQDICRGDSGGPLFCNQKLVGVVSIGVSSNKNFPIIFTDVLWHYEWILEIFSAGARLQLSVLFNLLLLFCIY